MVLTAIFLEPDLVATFSLPLVPSVSETLGVGVGVGVMVGVAIALTVTVGVAVGAFGVGVVSVSILNFGTMLLSS